MVVVMVSMIMVMAMAVTVGVDGLVAVGVGGVNHCGVVGFALRQAPQDGLRIHEGFNVGGCPFRCHS